MLDFIKLLTTVRVPFESFQANQPRDLVAVVADVSDFYAGIKFSSETVESLIGVFFGEGGSAPIKEPD